MKIYIPPHLKRLEIIQYLSLMIKEYSSTYSGNQEENYISEKVDPVEKFLSSCINESMIDSKTQDLSTVIKYITKLFYSVKGTTKVFEYIKKYLGLDIVGDIIYNTEYIEIQINNIFLSDEGTFTTMIKDFLEALLYFKELRLIVGEVDITIQGNINNNIGSKNLIYKTFDITNKDFIEL